MLRRFNGIVSYTFTCQIFLIKFLGRNRNKCDDTQYLGIKWTGISNISIYLSSYWDLTWLLNFFWHLCLIRSSFNLIIVLEKQWRDLISDFALILINGCPANKCCQEAMPTWAKSQSQHASHSIAIATVNSGFSDSPLVPSKCD